GRAEQRRCRVAAIVQVGLVRIALNFVDVHPVEASVQEVGKVKGTAVFDIADVSGLHGKGDLRRGKSGTRKRRSPHDDYLDRLSAQCQGDGSGYGSCRQGIESDRLGGKARRRQFEAITAEGQLGERVNALSIGLKSLDRSGDKVFELSCGG